jgi:two-component system sensor histidine kinase VicK
MTATAYWKRFAASATSYARRYREDLFFRTEVHVVLLQVAFAAFLLFLLSAAFTFLYRESVTNLIEGLRQSLRMGGAAGSAGVIAENLQYLKMRSIVIVSTVVLMGTAVFGYLIAKLSLAPTREALERQKQFIANVAHELRTPLAIIKTNSEVRLLDDDVPMVSREILTSNLVELDRISTIINNLLSLSSSLRPERIEFGNVDLGKVAATAAEHLADLAGRRRVSVAVRAEGYRTVWGNESALEQVALNVLKNALTYTRGGGSVEVSVAADQRGHVELVVRDTGVGIPERELAHIFEPFYRGDASRTRNGSGSGLGLSIVNELVKLHGGKITIRSAQSRGTSVHILLPVGKEADARPGGLGEDEEVGEVSLDFSAG